VAQLRTVLSQQNDLIKEQVEGALFYEKTYDVPKDARGYGNERDIGPGYLNDERRWRRIDAEREDFKSTESNLAQKLEQLQQRCNF